MLGRERGRVRSKLQDLDDFVRIQQRQRSGVMEDVENGVRLEALEHVPSTGRGGRRVSR